MEAAAQGLRRRRAAAELSGCVAAQALQRQVHKLEKQLAHLSHALGPQAVAALDSSEAGSDREGERPRTCRHLPPPPRQKQRCSLV